MQAMTEEEDPPLTTSNTVPPLPINGGNAKPSRIPKRINRFISTSSVGKNHFQQSSNNNHHSTGNSDSEEELTTLSDEPLPSSSTAIPTSPPPLLSTSTTLEYPVDGQGSDDGEGFPLSPRVHVQPPTPENEEDTTLLDDITNMHSTLAHFENSHHLKSDKRDTLSVPTANGSTTEPYTPRSDHVGYFSNAAAAIDDAISGLQSEHAAYVEVMEETHASEVQRLKQEIEFYRSMSSTEELQREVQVQLATMREQLEHELRTEMNLSLQQQQQPQPTIQQSPEELQQHMQQELERMVEIVRKEAAEQLQTQTEELKLEIEARVRQEMQTETERKMRMALLQQMRPQVRAELEAALRLEIRTSHATEIRKEVEAAVVADVEKRITADLKAKHQRVVAETKSQVESLVQERLTGARRELEDRIRQEVEQQFEKKVAKRVEKEIKGITEKIRKELNAEQEKAIQAQMASMQAQLKTERAEIARLKSVEHIRRNKEAASRKEAEESFKQQVEEFRRHVADEEARLAKQRSLVAYNAERSHNQQQKQQQGSHSPQQQHQQPQLPPQQAPQPQQPPTPQLQSQPHERQHLQQAHHSQQLPQPQQLHISPPQAPQTPQQLPAAQPSPFHQPFQTPQQALPSMHSSHPSQPPQPQNFTSPSNLFATPLPPSPPTIIRVQSSPFSPHSGLRQPQQLPPPLQLQPQQSTNIYSQPELSHPPRHNPSIPKPTPTAQSYSSSEPPLVSPYSLLLQNNFDFKAIATKLVNDAKARTQQQQQLLQPQYNQVYPSPSPQTKTNNTNNNSSNNNNNNNAVMTLGDFEEERRAQIAFESAPPIIPPAGFIGDRLRALLPRVYQLWDACEIAHVHRLAFSTAVKGMDCETAERRVAAEITRLRNLLPKVENEMKLVARREIIKARLGELDTLQADSKSVNAEKTTLRNELKRITSLVQPMIAAWEKTNAQPFLYRGFRYLTLMTGGSNSSA